MQATLGSWNDGIAGWSAALVYMGIIVLTFVFLIMYIKRMITIAFLILISPIITITYSIDKINDGKSQALDTWTKEFLQNVLIQPFHCIIYLVFISVGINIVSKSGTLAAGIIVILTMFFIFEAEKIIKNIFGINSDTTGSGMKTALTIVGTMTALKKFSEKSLKASKPSQPTGSANNINTPSGGDSLNTKVNQSNVATNNLNAVNNVSNNNKEENSNLNVSNLAQAQSQDYAYLMDEDDYEENNNKNEKNSNISQSQMELIAKKMGLSGNVYNTGINEDNTKPISNENPKDISSENLSSKPNIHTNDDSTDDSTVEIAKNDSSFIKKVGNSKIIKGVSKAAKYTYKGIKFTAKHQVGGFNSALAFTAMTAQGVSGDASPASLGAAGVAGYQVGKYTEEKAKQAYNVVKQPFKQQYMKYKERDLTSAYNNYKNTNKLSDAQMDKETQKFMNMDQSNIKDIKNKDAQVYAKALKSMPQIYADNGYDDPNQELQNTLNRIKNENKRREQKNREDNADAQRKNADIHRANINNFNGMNKTEEEKQRDDNNKRDNREKEDDEKDEN